MILKSFLLGNLLSLCMKIINSVVVVGLYYGFLTTFSIGPSYLFLLRARVMEEGTEKEISATTGFITGQLMMFISIYYAPLHLALGRPHTITVLVLPYLLFHFFWNNHKNFFDYGSTTRNSMRNLSIQCVFLNNLILQLFNHFILPSSTLARLVNIYMFRCNNKMLFVTSSFVGWLIGHILFMKWVGLVLFWILQNHSIRSNKYLVSELRNSMARIFSILLFITCVYYLGRMPSPIGTRKLKETSETEESDVETTYETKKTKQEQEGSTKEDKDSPVYEDSYLDIHQDNWELGKLKEDKTYFWFEKPIVTFLFDYKRWNRPLRYLKNDRFENAIRNEMAQYFFYICPNKGKQIISFTYPPSLSTFSEMIEQKISLYTTEKLSHEDLYNYWVYNNEKKKYNLKNEFISRIKILEKDKGSFTFNILEKRSRLCDDEHEQEYLPKMYDPFLNGPYRGTIKNLDSHEIMTDFITSRADSIEILWINKIHGLFHKNSQAFEHKKNRFYSDEAFLSNPIENSLTSIDKFYRIDSESQAKSLKFLFDVITTDSNDLIKILKNSIEMKEIKVSRWSYKLIDDCEEDEEESLEDPEIRSRKGKRVVIYIDNDQSTNSSTTNNTTSNTSDEGDEMALIRYSKQSYFRRGIIKGSMRAQRRKTIIWEMFQANVHSPLFLDRIDKTFFFSFLDISKIKNWLGGTSESQIYYFEQEHTKENEKTKEEKKEENEQIAISEVWKSYIFIQAIRGTQSFLRKYVILPVLIIAKNISRILLFPEWYEEWNGEIHVKCTYNGVQLSETEFPKNWLRDGIQIKILFPFCLKPWQRSKVRFNHGDQRRRKKEKKDNFCFLTVWGRETELPFGSPLKRPSFFEPIFKVKKKAIKAKNQILQVIRVFKERGNGVLKVSKKKKRWVIKIILFIDLIMKELEKVKPIFKLKSSRVKVYEPNENGRDSNINNKILHESTIAIQSLNCVNANYSLIETKMKDLANKTITIKSQIEGITKDKKKMVLTYDDKRSELQKDIWQIFKRKNIRLIRKSHYFIKSFIEKIYMNILLCIIKIPKINTQLFFKSTNKIVTKSIYNDKTNQEGIEKTNQNTMHFISTIKKLFYNIFYNTHFSISNKNPNKYYFSSLSQAYVFYKFSQNQLLNKYPLKSVLQYHNTHTFLADIIKNYCTTRGIFGSKPKHNKMHKYRMNKWKMWLRGHSQYNLSRTKWSYLVPKKWQNRANQYRIIQKKDATKSDLYKKEKDQLKKHYGYDLLSYKYINFEDNKNSYIYGSTLKLQEVENNKISYTLKPEPFYGLIRIVIKNYLEKRFLIDTNKNMDRQFFDYKIPHFCIINNIDIETRASFDWMGMNQEILYRTISNLEPWFFPELVLLFNAYKKSNVKPWIIPTKLLILNFHFYENISKSKKINVKKKKNEQQGQRNLVSDLRKQDEKDVEPDYTGADIKKDRKKKQSKSKKEAELNLFLQKYFLFQLRWDDLLNQRMINNIKVYCLLLKLIDPKEIAISSIQKGEHLDVMLFIKIELLKNWYKEAYFLSNQFAYLCKGMENIFYIKPYVFHWLIRINAELMENTYYNMLIKKKFMNMLNNTAIHLSLKTKIIMISLFLKIFYPPDVVENCEFSFVLILKIGILYVEIQYFVIKTTYATVDSFCRKNTLIQIQINSLNCFFLWPNYRLEDLACMNRYWFDTNNGSNFSISRIYMYPRFSS
uniref:Protein TIC 214 n=1 Tax=Allium macranthum TaxID=165633 RepID=A0A6M8TWL7_9ASPA|nr:hypothetical chloroplast RF19 [Allium macranthum]QKJ80755.1 hypothetical chloroplast RF19 [Allium macranthum]